MKDKCVLAYSGGLDTSAIIPWIRENYDYDVIAYCCNVGNLPPEAELRERALRLGAAEFVYEDAQEEFVRDFVFPLLRGGATYFDDYLLGTAIARPLIAKKAAAFAKKQGAKCIAHGATGKGNDHVRFERAWSFLCPEIEILAPWKVWTYRSREELISFLKDRDTHWEVGKKTYSVDVNTFHRSSEGGNLEEIESPYEPSDIQEWIALDCNLPPRNVIVHINHGLVVGLDHKDLSPREVIEHLNALGAAYGIGICDIVEERANGIKSRGIYETPGGTIAQLALKSLKQICWSRELYSTSQSMSDLLGTLIYNGLWFSDARTAIDSFFATASQSLSGQIHLTLTKSGVRISSRRSHYSLYRTDVVSFESDEMDIHRASLGYTKILTLSTLIQGQRERGLS